jgi:hypothetical protein
MLPMQAELLQALCCRFVLYALFYALVLRLQSTLLLIYSVA